MLSLSRIGNDRVVAILIIINGTRLSIKVYIRLFNTELVLLVFFMSLRRGFKLILHPWVNTTGCDVSPFPGGLIPPSVLWHPVGVQLWRPVGVIYVVGTSFPWTGLSPGGWVVGGLTTGLLYRHAKVGEIEPSEHRHTVNLFILAPIADVFAAAAGNTNNG